jgi:hypothetical protein
MISGIDKLAFMADQFSKAANYEDEYSFVGEGFLEKMVMNSPPKFRRFLF